MDPIAQQTALAAAGAAGEEALYVDDVFSTFLYEGNNSSQTITNGIDLDGEGGLVWVKGRTSSFHNHIVMDTERGATSSLKTNSTDGAETISTRVTGFTSTGFTVGSNSNVNASSNDFVSWTFRKAPGFFDIVTYTGNATAGGDSQVISHNLGSVPGLIIVKRTDTADDWAVWHRSLGATKYLELNNTNAEADNIDVWNDTEPTSTNFTVGWNGRTNGNNSTYVAYIFAHDEQSFGTDEDEAIIKCGEFTDAGSSGTTVDLGFEPQFVLFKKTNSTSAWYMQDVMRGMAANADTGARLYANTPSDEDGGSVIGPTATGFFCKGSFFSSGDNIVYIAIRRPHKPPEAATDVFKPFSLSAGEGQDTFISTGFDVDTFIYAKKNNSLFVLGDRLRGPSGGGDLLSSSTSAEGTNSGAFFLDHSRGATVDFADGHLNSSPASTSNSYVRYFFRRAPGFFDVVAYAGTGSSKTVSHNLAATPELIIVKTRSGITNWYAYVEALGIQAYLVPNKSEGASTGALIWNSTSPTSSVFSVAGGGWNVNESGQTYIAYLFASLSGVSKIGSYTGTGSNIDVDCGFTAGARFVLIKRTDGAAVSGNGDWYVYDSARGIVGGNDPYLLLNNGSTAEVTNTDYIDPLNSGFTVTSSAPADLNASGGTYIFLAIA